MSALCFCADKGRMDDMEFQNYFPVWNKLNTVHQGQILGTLITRTVKKGTIIVRVPRKLGGEKGPRKEEKEKKEQAIKSMGNPKRK